MKFLFRECYPDERSWSIEKKPSSACRNPLPQMFLSMRKTIVHMLVTNRLYVIIGIVPRFLPYDLRNKSKRKRRMDTESPCLTHATHRRRIILPELFCMTVFLIFHRQIVTLFPRSKPHHYKCSQDKEQRNIGNRFGRMNRLRVETENDFVVSGGKIYRPQHIIHPRHIDRFPIDCHLPAPREIYL